MIQQAIGTDAVPHRTRAPGYLPAARRTMRWTTGLAVVTAMLAAGCNGEIYVRDGVTDGDTFYLAEQAMTDTDPAFQSWVSYSLTRSTCQLQIGGENPARASSYDCEVVAREHLYETWNEQKLKHPGAQDLYLDQLATVAQAGFLREYVAAHFSRRHWQLPADLDVQAYRAWRRHHLPRHERQTRLTGSWNYARNVRAASTGRMEQ